MAVVPYPDRDDLPEEYRYLWERTSAAAGQAAPPNVHRALSNNPRLWQQYGRFVSALWSDSEIEPELRELIILRLAILEGSRYEWHQHTRIAREQGLTSAQILALHGAGDYAGLAPRAAAALRFVDAVARKEDVSPDAHRELMAHFPPSAVVALTVLAGFYVMTAVFLRGLEVEPEEEFVGWRLEGSGGRPGGEEGPR